MSKHSFEIRPAQAGEIYGPQDGRLGHFGIYIDGHDTEYSNDPMQAFPTCLKQALDEGLAPGGEAEKWALELCEERSQHCLERIVQHIRDRFDIREVTDGEAAWQAILLDSSIRVVITDLTMPKVDGFELLNRVRSSKVQRIRELPIVVISGEDEGAEPFGQLITVFDVRRQRVAAVEAVRVVAAQRLRVAEARQPEERDLRAVRGG